MKSGKAKPLCGRLICKVPIHWPPDCGDWLRPPKRNTPAGLGGVLRKSDNQSRLCHGGIMSRLPFVLCRGLVMVLPLALGGCAGGLVVGGLAGAAGGGYAAAQERGVDGVVNDWEVQNDIKNGFMTPQPG